MGNFGRAIALSLKYRWSFIASICCALAVAVLWGGSITTVYPFVKVAFQEQSLQDDIEARIDRSREMSIQLTREVEALELQWASSPPSERRRVAVRLRVVQDELEAHQQTLKWSQYAKPYVDRYVPTDRFLTLGLVIVMLLTVTIVKSLFVVAHKILVGRLAQLGTYELRNDLYDRVLSMDVSTFTNEGTADQFSRCTNDTNAVTTGLVFLFGNLVREPLKLAACLIGAAWICWPLLAISLVIVPPAALLMRWLARTLKRANRLVMEEIVRLYDALQETFGGITVIKAFTTEPQERDRFRVRTREHYRQVMRSIRFDSLSHPLTEILGVVIICLALLPAAYLLSSQTTHIFGLRVSQQPLSPAVLAMFYAFLAGVVDPARKLSQVFAILQKSAAASDRVYELLDRRPAVSDPQHPVAFNRHQRELVFEGVQFAYVPGQPVLHDINLSIRFGERVAIVGPSGCGKSTLAKLILRFADPTAGTVSIDGTALVDLRLRDLRGQIGLVTQEPVLFNATVLENIRYGSPEAAREKVVEAAKRAHAHEFIERELPLQYDAVAGPKGAQLSGGQRQRLALARAILRDPAILILDEATSQIDPESERLIHDALREFIHNRTTVIITHRVSALSLVDRVVVMNGGRILETGTHRELSVRSPFYRNLFQIQPDETRRSA